MLKTKHSKIMSLLPIGRLKLIVETVLQDSVLDTIANITRDFLLSTWKLPSQELFNHLFNSELKTPIKETILRTLKKQHPKLNIKDEDIKFLVESLTKTFADQDTINLLVEKMLLTDFSPRTILVSFAAYPVIFMMHEATRLLLRVLDNTSPMYKLDFDAIMRDSLNKRIEFLRQVTTTPSTDNSSVSKTLNNTQARVAELREQHQIILKPEYYIRHAKSRQNFYFALSLIIFSISLFVLFSYCGLDLLFSSIAALTCATLIAKFTAPVMAKIVNDRAYRRHELMNRRLEEVLLSNLKADFIPSQPSLENSQDNSSIKKQTTQFIENNTDNNLQHALLETIKVKKRTVKKRIEELAAQITSQKTDHKMREKPSATRIVWTVTEASNKKSREIIYHPVKLFSRVIELWTTHPNRKNLNERDYIFWDTRHIQTLFVKKKKIEMYPTFFRLGQRGQEVGDTGHAGFVDISHYNVKENPNNYSKKLKVETSGAGAYNLFFQLISKTTYEEVIDTKVVKSEKLLHGAAAFKKTHFRV